MKLNYLLAGSLAILLGFSSCTNDENCDQNRGVIRLNAIVNDVQNTRLGSSWAGTENIGFYMLEDKAEFTVTTVVNKQYNVASTGAMSAADGVEATYPTDGSNVKFMAYYPHQATLADHVYPIDLSSTTITDHDLVYATTASYNQTNTEAVKLAFNHQLTKLVINIQSEGGSALTGATAVINRASKASFNLKDGSLAVTANSDKDIAMTVQGSAAEAVILPTTGGKVIFTSEGKTYTWDISAISFAKGKKYSYNIKLIPTPIPAVEVSGTATITPWGDEVGGDINVTEDEEIVTPPAEDPVYTSNIALPTGTAAVQTNAYAAKVKINDVEFAGMKIGTSNAGGKYETEIGVGKTEVVFYACAWTGINNTKLIVTTTDGTTKTIDLIANVGATGNPPHTIDPSGITLYKVEIPMSGSATKITFDATGTGKRALIFGVNAK